MAKSALTIRDRGFALVGRLNRWLIAGAIALSGGLSVAAANAFHGRTRSQSASTSAAGVSQHSSGSGGSNTSGGSSGGGTSSNGGASGLQAPAQAPASAPASPSGGVVSGGS